MIVTIKFRNEKVRNLELLKAAFEQFVSAFTFLDVAVDLSDVKRDLMEVSMHKPKEKRK